MFQKKALVLLSGGLDSMLAVRLLQNQGFVVVGICFCSNFFGSAKAESAAKNLGIELQISDISQELLDIVKNPPSGYGKNLNPCVDCHALMLRKAAEFVRTGEFDFLATGEVLGQRPFSQNRKALEQVERLAGIEVLRPLSAKLLPETSMEKNGLVARGLLEKINGRRRERQMELAEKFRLNDFPLPAGGCILTDPDFSLRLGKILVYYPGCSLNDIELLKHGRVFWFDAKEKNAKKKVLLMIGRHEQDNDVLESLAKKGDFVVQLKVENGPTAVIRYLDADSAMIAGEYNVAVPEKLELSRLMLSEEKSNKEIADIAMLLTGYYSTKSRGREIAIKITNYKS